MWLQAAAATAHVEWCVGSVGQVIDPADFGVGRSIQIAHRLTGWNAVQERCTSEATVLHGGRRP